jgi:hypothetical protein
MHPKGSCKCQHCGEFFVPDVRNRTRQRVCDKPPCRKARKAQAQQQWLQRAENAGYFRGAHHVERVQAWRRAHPGYWRGRQRRGGALQDTSITQTTAPQRKVDQDDESALQDSLGAQAPLLVGLVSHLAGSALQADIAQMMRRLHSRGRAVLGKDVPRPTYGKTRYRKGAGAARTAPV